MALQKSRLDKIFHQFVNKMCGREVKDTFPTLYLANSVGQVEGLARNSGLEVIGLKGGEGRPIYLRLTAVTHLFGLLYERIVNTTSLLCRYRILFIAELRKPAI